MEIAFENVVQMEHGLVVNQNVKVRRTLYFATKQYIVFLLEIRCSALKIHPRVIQACLPSQNQTNKFRFGTICRAKCNETGYRLIGPRTRECLNTGKWTGYEQFCIGKYILNIDKAELRCIPFRGYRDNTTFEHQFDINATNDYDHKILR